MGESLVTECSEFFDGSLPMLQPELSWSGMWLVTLSSFVYPISSWDLGVLFQLLNFMTQDFLHFWKILTYSFLKYCFSPIFLILTFWEWSSLNSAMLSVSLSLCASLWVISSLFSSCFTKHSPRSALVLLLRFNDFPGKTWMTELFITVIVLVAWKTAGWLFKRTVLWRVLASHLSPQPWATTNQFKPLSCQSERRTKWIPVTDKRCGWCFSQADSLDWNRFPWECPWAFPIHWVCSLWALHSSEAGAMGGWN